MRSRQEIMQVLEESYAISIKNNYNVSMNNIEIQSKLVIVEILLDIRDFLYGDKLK